MDSSTLLYPLMGIFLIAIGRCTATAVEDEDRSLECYECVYYRGDMELNPQCKDIKDRTEDVPKKTDCQFCKIVVAKDTATNHTRTVVKRQCSRFCVHLKEVDVTYQDMKNMPGREYCCETDLCNVGDNAISNHQGAALLLLVSSLLAFLLSIR